MIDIENATQDEVDDWVLAEKAKDNQAKVNKMNLLNAGLDAQQMTVDANKIAILKAMIDAHDLTYDSSDDGSMHQRGRDQVAAITSFVETNAIDKKTFAELWNANVDKKIHAEYRKEYYMAVNYE